MNEINDSQLEMTFAQKEAIRYRRNRKPAPRAGWWFSHMREVVNRTMEWTCASSARPVQTTLGAHFTRETVLD